MVNVSNDAEISNMLHTNAKIVLKIGIVVWRIKEVIGVKSLFSNFTYVKLHGILRILRLCACVDLFFNEKHHVFKSNKHDWLWVFYFLWRVASFRSYNFNKCSNSNCQSLLLDKTLKNRLNTFLRFIESFQRNIGMKGCCSGHKAGEFMRK